MPSKITGATKDLVKRAFDTAAMALGELRARQLYRSTPAKTLPKSTHPSNLNQQVRTNKLGIRVGRFRSGQSSPTAAREQYYTRAFWHFFWRLFSNFWFRYCSDFYLWAIILNLPKIFLKLKQWTWTPKSSSVSNLKTSWHHSQELNHYQTQS